MQAFTVRNAVIVSLVQVAIIVFGTLAIGLNHKVWKMTAGEMAPPAILLQLRDYGAALLVIPLLWIALAVWVRSSARASDPAKALAFLSGFALLAALFALMCFGLFSPWLDWTGFHTISANEP